MRSTRRWLSALVLALGLVPGADRILLAHVHGDAGPVLSAAAAGASAGREASLDCAACHARATLDTLAIDAHPERHGAAPAAPPLEPPAGVRAAPRPDTPRTRGPPAPIV